VGHFFQQPQALAAELRKLNAQETMLQRWLRVASDAGRLTTPDVPGASAQLHSLIKGAAFWHQLMGLQPILSQTEQAALAERTADLFLSHSTASVKQ